jgi:hypothetical protein
MEKKNGLPLKILGINRKNIGLNTVIGEDTYCPEVELCLFSTEDVIDFLQFSKKHKKSIWGFNVDYKNERITSIILTVKMSLNFYHRSGLKKYAEYLRSKI